ncbi:ribonuclease HII [Lacticigenium naphthae]|uniref:ribonuclease HII n=1 Tax=Lacticigenium naphthae TaxID=515351 RepID=UPI0004290AD4|nr:ribonuclease HII [Lacticigenium naphthae]
MTSYKIKEIPSLLASVSSKEDPLYKELLEDPRKGVQKALISWEKKQLKEAQLKQLWITMNKYEEYYRKQGVTYIAGIDEVGRGPLAGPVVAAAVILPADFTLPGLNDSKKLSKEKRENFYKEIYAKALAVGVGEITPERIDQINIYEASKQAMLQAVNQLAVQPEHLLIDAMQLAVPIPQTKIIKGDAKSVSIAAASVIAKVTRDRMMEIYDLEYPGYGFATNAGYGTKEHLNQLQTAGVTPIHRKSFQPVKDLIY